MRNAEFSHPLTEERINAIFEGDIDPEPFDYIAAEAHLMAHAAGKPPSPTGRDAPKAMPAALCPDGP